MFFRKLLAYFRGYLLKTKIQADGPIKSFGRTIVRNHGGVIRMGKRCAVWPEVKLTLVSPPSGEPAVIEVGDYTSIGDRSQIHCGSSVKIGNQSLIAWDVNIIEYDYHAPGGGRPAPGPIVIEDETWIGARSIILKGVTIGRGSIVAAGAVVTKDVPPFTIVAGNPARAIRQTAAWTGSTAPGDESPSGDK